MVKNDDYYEKRKVLVNLINEYFTQEEVEQILYLWGTIPEKFGSKGKKNRIIEIVSFMERTDRLRQFVEIFSIERPHLKWPEFDFSSDAGQEDEQSELTEKERLFIKQTLENVRTTSTRYINTVSKEIIDKFHLLSEYQSIESPNIQGKWRSIVNEAQHVIEITQLGTFIKLHGVSEEDTPTHYSFSGEGRLYGNILLFQWTLSNKQQGLNIMMVDEDAETIDGKYITQTGGSGSEIYVRWRLEPSQTLS